MSTFTMLQTRQSVTPPPRGVCRPKQRRNDYLSHWARDDNRDGDGDGNDDEKEEEDDDEEEDEGN